MSSPHVPLWCKSHYSFLEGASSPQELVEEARALGHSAIALTDRDGVYGIVRAHVAAKEAGIRLIVGSEVTLDDESTIVLLARNIQGYQRLCRLISRGRLRSPKGSSRVSLEEVATHAQGLIALWGGSQSRLVRPDLPSSKVHTLKEAFGERLYAMVARHRRAEETREEAQLRSYAARFGLPLVAATEVLYHRPERRDLQDVMTCIRARCTLAEAGARTRPNAEFGLRSAVDFEALFADNLAWVEQTAAIAEACSFSLDDLRYVYPAEGSPSGLTPDEWLRELTYQGARRRYPQGIPPAVETQLEKELALIQELDYGGYFLTMRELVDFCERNEILCQGRGSAANSALCYCLGITAVDPAQMDLLFERFLSRERAEPPDIDLDIAHHRREEVIQYMYERFGRDRAAMVANVIRYRGRSAFRDVASAFGVPLTTIDRVSKLLSHGRSLREDALSDGGMSLEHPSTQHILRLSRELIDAPRHLSIHPGGFIIGQGPVHELVPIENATMEQRTVIQWDKYDVEELGLFKIDLLGLGALTHLDDAFGMVRASYGHDWCMARIPRHDEKTWAMLERAETVGVFQIESRAQMAMLPRLRPRDFYDLVIQISIVRPGPITGGMVHPYLRRRNQEEPVTWPHPTLRSVLQRTLGVPLFQEQVMKLAIVAADYTPGEADQLRRDMGAWRQNGRIEAHRDRLIERMSQKGIALEFAERVFNQIRGFGEYGFPESHAASFALIAWASSWMRAHYMEAFTAALLNAQPMGFYSASTILNDARHQGVEIRPIDARASAWFSTLEPSSERCDSPPMVSPPTRVKSAIRLGFHQVKGLRRGDIEALLRARAEAPFASLEDLLVRSDLREDAALKLAKAGAFEALIPNRRDAIWALRRYKRSTPLPLFEGLDEDARNDAPSEAFAELSDADRLRWDYEETGASADAHILEPLRPALQSAGFPDAAKVQTLRDGARVRYAGVVICRQRPQTASGVTFMTLEDETGIVNVVIWRDTWEKNATFLKTHSLIAVSGRLQVQGRVVHLVGERFWAPELGIQTPKIRSYDFR